MTLRPACCTLVLAVCLLPGPATGQSARNANVWDGRAHQPSAGDVHERQRDAGVAPPDSHARAQEEELGRIGKQLSDRAAENAKSLPDNATVYGVQPGGVVPVPPPPQTPGPYPATR